VALQLSPLSATCSHLDLDLHQHHLTSTQHCTHLVLVDKLFVNLSSVSLSPLPSGPAIACFFVTGWI